MRSRFLTSLFFVSNAMLFLLSNLAFSQSPKDVQAAKAIFRVLGEVNVPGDYELSSDVTITKAVEKAGGIPVRSSKENVTLFRGTEKQTVDLQAILAGSKPDILLVSGDMVVIGSSTFRIEGKVKAPGIYDFTVGSDPLQALTASGGPVEGADLQAAYLERKDKLIPINLSMPASSSDKHASLQIGDILMVPERTVTVTGEVEHPGVYALVPGKNDRLQDAIAAAGGVTKKATLKKVQVKRLESEKTKTTLYDVTKSRNQDTNPVLQKGDAVYVPGADPKRRVGLNDLYQALVIVFTLGSIFGR